MTKLQSSGQLGLPIDYFRELDRNFEKGGRSFYFFDLDDNVVHLHTEIFVFHKESAEERAISTQDWAAIHPQVGKEGSFWESYQINLDPAVGSFRNFRDHPNKATQALVTDMESALKNPQLEWRGPSWDFFVHAVYNNRPIAVITARGHHPQTIRRALDVLVQSRDLACDPNYLSIYPVSHPETRRLLGDNEFKWNTAQLKKAAIHKAVQDAFNCYGKNPYHRFGMSDDDPHNVQLIQEAMHELKQEHPENAFFVINTHERKISKEEIMAPSKEQSLDIEGFSHSLLSQLSFIVE